MTDDPATVHVLGNPSARGASEHLERVVAELARRGARPEVLDAADPEAAADAATMAVRAGSNRLVCVGGDGVVRIGVGATAETETVLGVVPFGTGNDFARALGLLDGDVSEHVARALGDPVAVDAMRTDHGWVASVATLGFSGDVTERANGLSWPRGQQRYTVATVLQLPRLRRIPLVVDVDGEVLELDTTLVAVGNTAYFGGGMRICPAATPDDGRLQLVAIGAVSRLRFLRVFPKVFGGSHVEDPSVTVRSGERITISLAGPTSADTTSDRTDDRTHDDGAGEHRTDDDRPGVDVWADGDPLGPLPVACRAAPGALRVAGASTS